MPPMRATFVIGWVGHQSDTTATLWLAHEGARRGHDVAFVDYLDLSVDAGGAVWGRARRPDVPTAASRKRYAASLRAGAVRIDDRRMSDDDVVFLRNNPVDRFSSWIEKVGNPAVAFGRLLEGAGVRVINRPDGLERARHPAWLVERVPDLLPRGVITRDVDRILAFLRDLDAPAALKPLAGYGGHGVFHVRRGQVRNVRATIELLAHEGYVVAQEWLPEAARGDKRVLLWRGAPIPLGGDRWSAYRRKAAAGDHRNNVHAGGRRRACGLDERELAICRRVGAHLAGDGLDLVGLDLVGDRVLEVNVFCPGGIHNMHALYGGNVAARIWDDLEGEKVG